jgi:phytoene/squalene synthetase
LLLHLYGVTEPQHLAESDCICSALQLINFWQDLSVDLPRQRHYLPLNELDRCGLTAADVLQDALHTHKAAEESILIANLSNKAIALMQQGQQLPLHIPGRAGWELRLVVQGGLGIARKVSQLQHACLHTRPKLGVWDVPTLLWRAWRMA